MTTTTEVPDEQVEQLKELRDSLEEVAAKAHQAAYKQDGYDFEKDDELAEFHECVSDAVDEIDSALNVAHSINSMSPGEGYDL